MDISDTLGGKTADSLKSRKDKPHSSLLGQRWRDLRNQRGIGLAMGLSGLVITTTAVECFYKPGLLVNGKGYFSKYVMSPDEFLGSPWQYAAQYSLLALGVFGIAYGIHQYVSAYRKESKILDTL